MPLLQHTLKPRDVLKYEADITVLEQGDEVELKLLFIVKIGEEGKLAVEPRLVERSGALSASHSESFLRPDSRSVKPSGASPDGLASLAFLPVLSEHGVEPGDEWATSERGVLVSYELCSLRQDEPRAEIMSRKTLQDAQGRRVEVEGLYDFDVTQGRVVSAQVVTEVHGRSGLDTRTVAEYRLA
jgi:ribosomal protein L35AE/L33A